MALVFGILQKRLTTVAILKTADERAVNESRPARGLRLDFRPRLDETSRHDAPVPHLPDTHNLPLASLLAGARLFHTRFMKSDGPARLMASSRWLNRYAELAEVL